MAYIINNSIKFGIFPDKLKLAEIIPVYKKGDPGIISNYRPISLLSSFAKVIEKVMHARIKNFFIKNKLFSPEQHGFLEGRSTDTAVFQFLRKIIDSLEKKEIILGLFLDLSKAFDCLNYDLFILKLEKYGVRGPALAWVKSYLSNRYHRVVLEKDNTKHVSRAKKVVMGIPQGSIIGPLFLCNIY